jgi:transcriptional regulator with XRE-family HTH domain
MKLALSQQQIGQRVVELRKIKGLSQADLAKRISISRPSLAQIELGNRSIDVFELFNLAQVLGFSLDEFLSPDFRAGELVANETRQPAPKDELRVSVPVFDLIKFRNVLLYLLEQCAGKPNVGETVLNQLLYFCDFNFYELYEEHLTSATYKKLPSGPLPLELSTVLSQMIDQGYLKRIKTEFRGAQQMRYLPLEKADITQLSAAEKVVVDQVVQQVGDWNAAQVTGYAHQDMPMLATKDGDLISYNLVFYRELPYSVRVYGEED